MHYTTCCGVIEEARSRLNRKFKMAVYTWLWASNSMAEETSHKRLGQSSNLWEPTISRDLNSLLNKEVVNVKNCVYKDYFGELSTIGYLEEVIWKATSYCSGPREPGEYFTADGEGNVSRMQCTGDGLNTRDLFNGIVASHEYSQVEYYDGTNFREPTNDDLIELYTSHNVWYDTNEYWTDCGNEVSLTIYEGDAIPKYFLDTKFKGPIDSEIETNESVQMDLEYKPV